VHKTLLAHRQLFLKGIRVSKMQSHGSSSRLHLGLGSIARSSGPTGEEQDKHLPYPRVTGSLARFSGSLKSTAEPASSLVWVVLSF